MVNLTKLKTELKFETIGHLFGLARQISMDYLSHPITYFRYGFCN